MNVAYSTMTNIYHRYNIENDKLSKKTHTYISDAHIITIDTQYTVNDKSEWPQKLFWNEETKIKYEISSDITVTPYMPMSQQPVALYQQRYQSSVYIILLHLTGQLCSFPFQYV